MLNRNYEAILDEWETELKDSALKVFQALKKAYPDGLTRRQLIHEVYGVVVPESVDLNNNKYDRKIRLTIAALFERLIPIVSSSSQAGYRLDLSEETITKMIGEWSRRQEMYRQKVERGNRLLVNIRQFGARAMPVELTAQESWKQERLVE
jgi:hypothetical protein